MFSRKNKKNWNPNGILPANGHLAILRLKSRVRETFWALEGNAGA